MCGRYGFKPDNSFFDEYEITNRDDFEGWDNMNSSPGQDLPVIVMNSPKKLKLMRWGLGEHNLINARSETVNEKYSFKKIILNQRCLIPANGFWEWHEKKKYWIEKTESKFIVMAGIYDKDKFVIITKNSEGEMTKIHDRMPVILDLDEAEIWADNKNEEGWRNILLLKKNNIIAQELKYGPRV